MNLTEQKQYAFAFVTALLFTTFVTFLINGPNTFYFIMFFGQACFFTSYWYRLKKEADKSGFRFAFFTIIALVALFFAVVVRGMNFPMTLGAELFILYFALEQFQLAKEPLTFSRFLLYVALAVIFLAIYLWGVYGIEMSIPAAAFALLCTVPYMVQAFGGRKLPAADMLVLLASFIPMLFFVFQLHMHIISSLAFLLIFHGVQRMIGDYFHALSESGAAGERYLMGALVVNAIVLILFGLYMFGVPGLWRYLFGQQFFFWLILYAVFSLKVDRLIPYRV